ncbi:YceI family protein [Vibrio hepatarius]|uniref:YceI family protein n=1 Tax=Vibrio hepatarius TaxID=171383 RepID=UPI00148E8147|nr:YceI family protein [Vibrio hepatarius]NOI15320.1 YceI family protein [Vibrio hepatarius]
MKILPPFLGLLLALGSTAALSNGNYQLDPNLSSVSFATTKKQYIVEPATLNLLSGVLSEKGEFQVIAELKSLSTGVPIRDTRLNELYFDAAKYPNVTVSGVIDWQVLADGPVKTNISADVSMYGNTKKMDFPVIIVPTDNYLTVSSSAVVVVNAADFGIPTENLAKLAETVGGIEISTQVPLTLSLTFIK